MFVNEIEPEESMTSVAAGIPQTGQNVPGRSDHQKQRHSRRQPELSPPAPFPSYRQVQKRCSTRKRQRNQAFGEHAESHACISRIPAPGLSVWLKSGQEEIERRSDQQTQKDIRNENACKQENARTRV